MEALGAGTPMVGTAVGGIPDLIRRPELGLVVPPEDPQALAHALVQALRTRWSPETILEEARSYEWSTIAERYLGVYRSTLGLPEKEKEWPAT
jgi:glycosyltransferase involved in cell wall biosynthesis